jgi:hypothetical protein
MDSVYNYLGNSVVEELSGNGNTFVKVYNNGSAITEGEIKMLVPIWITGVGAVYVPIAVATNAAKTSIIGICQGAHAASTYQFYQTQGYVASVTTGTVLANALLEVINGGTTLIDEGAVGGTLPDDSALGVVVTVNTATNASVYLFGNPVVVEAA